MQTFVISRGVVFMSGAATPCSEVVRISRHRKADSTLTVELVADGVARPVASVGRAWHGMSVPYDAADLTTLVEELETALAVASADPTRDILTYPATYTAQPDGVLALMSALA